MRLRALQPSDPSLPLQCKGPNYPFEHGQHFFQSVETPPGGWGQHGWGRVGASGGGGLGTPQQVAPLCWGDVLGLLLNGGADEEGEDQPVSLEQASAHLHTHTAFCIPSLAKDTCVLVLLESSHKSCSSIIFLHRGHVLHCL